MSSEARRAGTADLLAKIDEVTSGHERQRQPWTPFNGMTIHALPLPIRLTRFVVHDDGTFSGYLAPLSEAARTVNSAFTELGQAFVEFFDSAAWDRLVGLLLPETIVVPVPFKASTHRYVKRRRR